MATDARDLDHPPLVMHVVYRFDTGGLENGIVNLLNHMPTRQYRHAVVALTQVTDFRRRIHRDDVEFIALNKGPGHGIWLYPRLFSLFRQRKPAIVHTRNLAALEAVVPACLARVPVRVHSEHGRDVGDLDGRNRKYQWLRRIYRPFVTHYVALSHDLADYLVDKVKVGPQYVTQVYNGVDANRFSPAGEQPTPIPGCPFDPTRHWLIGTVGRMQPVKDQCTLVRAFLRAIDVRPPLREHLRLVIVGDGPLHSQCQLLVDAAGASDLAWFPGERDDVAEVMRGLHCFVLPSLAEGVSNTILEAMASALPVIATSVGGNADLVAHDETGMIVAPGDVEAISDALIRLASSRQRAGAMGKAGREKVEARFSIQAMVAAYRGVYDGQITRARAQFQRA